VRAKSAAKRSFQLAAARTFSKTHAKPGGCGSDGCEAVARFACAGCGEVRYCSHAPYIISYIHRSDTMLIYVHCTNE
jgi:hypothetical protein